MGDGCLPHKITSNIWTHVLWHNNNNKNNSFTGITSARLFNVGRGGGWGVVLGQLADGALIDNGL